MVLIVAAISVPNVLHAVDRSRGLAAARYLAGRMMLARSQAVGRAASVALRFEQGTRGIGFAVFQDGNGNGVRSRDITDGTDPEIEPATWLADLFSGVEIAVANDAVASSAVQLGTSNLLTFTPEGTATSGSIYVRGRDGTQWTVRVLGATGRSRVLRYVASSGDWVEAF